MSANTSFGSFASLSQTNPPQIGLVLGSGMSDAIADLDLMAEITFDCIPGLAVSTVAGHPGRLQLGNWHEKKILIFAGRLHFYEGHSWERVIKSVQIAHQLGVRTLLLTNAAGGIRDNLVPGSMMAIRDHIEWTRPYCWRHAGLDEIETHPASRKRKRPESERRKRPYSKSMLNLLHRAAGDLGIKIRQGVYACVTGPSYETPAEIRALQYCGADAVGMSTAREATAAYQLGMNVAALSLITNQAAGLSGVPLSHDEVLATASEQKKKLTLLLGRFVELM